MKNLLAIFLFLPLAFSSLHAQTAAIDVAENTLKVKGFGEEVFYYGFAAGDQLIFNFEEVKGKELKEVEIIEWPSSSRFMDYKTSNISNKMIAVGQTGIYKFRFANAAISGRVCKIKIQRIPRDEPSRSFNTAVLWRTVFDTVTTMVQERYLVKREYTPIPVMQASDFYINSGSNATFKGGVSRITLPVMLPANTTEWYYSFTASRNKIMIAQAKQSMDLFGQLTRLVDPSGITKSLVGMLTAAPGADYCDVYLLDRNNSALFEEKVNFRYFPEGTRTHMMSGIVNVKSGVYPNLYIGIKNPDNTVGVHVAIEVTAITLNEEWGIRDAPRYNITSRQQPYLVH